MREKRRFKRIVPLNKKPVEIQIMGHAYTDNAFLDVLYAKDISQGGVGVLVPHNFKGCRIHNIVELIITLPNTEPFKARGKIKHHRKDIGEGGFFGVEFTQIEAGHVEEIISYLNSIEEVDEES